MALTKLLKLVKQDSRNLRMLLASLDEMRILVDESHDRVLDPDEHEMIHSVIDLQTKSAKEIMVPAFKFWRFRNRPPAARLDPVAG